jgi:hypothetical protein
LELFLCCYFLCVKLRFEYSRNRSQNCLYIENWFVFILNTMGYRLNLIYHKGIFPNFELKPWCLLYLLVIKYFEALFD